MAGLAAELAEGRRDARRTDHDGCRAELAHARRGRVTVERVRKQFVEDGIEATLQPAPRKRVYERRLDGKGEAHLVALACGSPPEGRSRWTLRLLADRMVALEYVEELSYETVRRTLKKTSSSRG